MSLSRNGEDVLESCYLVGGHILLKFHRNLCDISFGSVGLLEYAAGYSRSINSMDERAFVERVAPRSGSGDQRHPLLVGAGGSVTADWRRSAIHT